ncbi:DUF4198 domain-containing protein [Novosphingobium aerophilum]|uniref:DUF4198 domain-containing protein n=1 Tax=Novosphingobium aerophilum TaxID=2839843 RepID=UPI003FD2C53C
MMTCKRLIQTSGIALALAASVATILPAQAHGIWFAQRARQLALVYGVGADDLDAVARESKLTLVKGYDEDWLDVNVRLRDAGAIPVVDSDEPVAAVAAVMDYGIWTKDAAGEFHNKGRDEVPGATLSEHNWKYAVHLTRMPTRQVPLLAGQTLQLVPVGTDIPQKMGQPMKVRVYFEGKPVAGAQVMTDYVNDPDEVPVKTDGEGYATIRLRNQGINVLMAIFVSPTDNPVKYQQVEHRASLSFVLPHLPE